MLFVFSAVFALIAIWLISKRGVHLSTFFLISIIFSWTASVMLLIVYLNSINYYYETVQRIFSLPKSIWLLVYQIGIRSDVSLRLLSFFVLAFSYFLLCFALNYVSSKRIQRNVYVLLAMPLFALWIHYDNGFYIWLYEMFPSLVTGSAFYTLDKVMAPVSHVVKLSYLFIAFIILIHYLITYPNIRFLKNRTLSTLLCLLPISAIHAVMFSWLPRRMVKPTLIKGYYNYLLPQIRSLLPFFNWLPYLVFLSLTVLIYTIYKYNTVESYHKNMDTHINKSIDVATLGIKAFTHSMKNHIIAIQSEVEFLETQIDNNEEAKYSLSLIRESINHTFASLDKANQKFKKVVLDLKPVTVEQFIYDAVSQNKRLLKHIAVNTYATHDSAKAYIDTYYMNEVIHNLLHNAVEALDSQDNKKPKITFSTKTLDNQIIISIADNGPGIEEENLKNIFLPFSSTKNPLNNWGVGLSYCHRIVTAHDGTIHVNSQLGSGTTFEIMLPMIRR